MTYWSPLTWTALTAEAPPEGLIDDETYVGVAANQLYTVLVYEFDFGWHHLSIRRFDRSACRDWRHLQWIKNEICGAEREAFELFPAESRLLDGANQFHLWVMPKGVTIPIGTTHRSVLDGQEGASPGSVQRPYAQDPDKYLGHVGLLDQMREYVDE